MTIRPGGEIGDEVHPERDQMLVFVDGRAVAELDGQQSEVGPNSCSSARARGTTSATAAMARFG